MPRPDRMRSETWKAWAALAWVVLIAVLYLGTLARSRPGLVDRARIVLARATMSAR